MPSLLAPIVAFYDYALQPVPAFAWLGAPVSALDVVGALRLAIFLRQARDQHVSRISATSSIPEDGERPEQRSRVRDLVATLVMVHGGEAIAGASRVLYLQEVCTGSVQPHMHRALLQHRGSACSLRSSSLALSPRYS